MKGPVRYLFDLLSTYLAGCFRRVSVRYSLPYRCSHYKSNHPRTVRRRQATPRARTADAHRHGETLSVCRASRVCLPHLVPHSSIGSGLHPAAPSAHRHCALSSQRLSSDLAASRAPRVRVLGLMRLKTHNHAAIPNRVGRPLSRSRRLRMRLRCSPLVCERDLSILGPSAGTILGSSCDAITRSPSPAPTQLLTRISATRPQCSGCRQLITQRCRLLPGRWTSMPVSNSRGLQPALDQY